MKVTFEGLEDNSVEMTTFLGLDKYLSWKLYFKMLSKKFNTVHHISNVYFKKHSKLIKSILMVYYGTFCYVMQYGILL